MVAERITISKTAADSLISCCRLGHTTLPSSSLVSWKNFVGLKPDAVSWTSASALVFFATNFHLPRLWSCEASTGGTFGSHSHNKSTRNFWLSWGRASNGDFFGQTLAPRLFYCINFERALEDLNPRHQVLETCVLPTELRAHKLACFLVYRNPVDKVPTKHFRSYKARSKRCLIRVALPTRPRR